MSQHIEGFMPLLLRASVWLGVSAVLVAVFIRLLRVSSARVRYGCWLLVLVQGAILLRFPLNVPWYEPGAPTAHDQPAQARGPNALESLPAPRATTLTKLPKIPRPVPSAHSRGAQAQRDTSRSVIAAAAWLVGLVVLTLWAAARYLQLLWRLKCEGPSDEAWVTQWRDVLSAAEVRRRIRLRVTRDLGPAVCLLPSGYCLLVPGGVWRELTPGQRRAILWHEVHHYLRGDLWKSLVARLLALPHWFNPLAWWAVAKLDECAEWLCDDAAIAPRSSALEYAHALLRLGSQDSLHATCASAARGGRLYVRIRRLIGAAPAEDSRVRRGILVGIVLAMALVGMIRVHLVAKEPSKAVGMSADATSSSATNAPSSKPPILLSTFGKVVDAAGKPMAGVTVYLREWSTFRVSDNVYDEHPQDVLATTQTDQQGAFRFQGVAAPAFRGPWAEHKPWDVVAVAKGFGLTWDHLKASQKKDITLTLRPEATITGRLTDRQGQPVPGAEVRVSEIAPLGSLPQEAPSASRRFDLQRSRLAPAATTAADGTFTIGSLPADVRVSIVITHRNHHREFVYVATCDGSQPDLEDTTFFKGKERTEMRKVYSRQFALTLAPAGPTVTGRALFADTGKPCAGARVDAYSPETRRGFQTVADASGHFVLRDLAPSQYHVSVGPPESSDYLGHGMMVNVLPEKNPAKVEVKLPRGEIVTGTVVDQKTGRGIAGVRLYMAHEAQQNLAASSLYPTPATTDRDGRFRLVMSAGKATLVVSGDIPGYFLPKEVSPRPDVPLDATWVRRIDVVSGRAAATVRFAIGRGLVIEGEVVDQEGKPVADAEVTAATPYFDPRWQPTARSDASGRFTMSGLDPKVTRRVMALHEGRRLGGRAVVPADPKAGATRDVTVRITLKPTATITGRVLAGQWPVAYALVTLIEVHRGHEVIEIPGKGRLDREECVRPVGTKCTDHDGRYTFNLVGADGEYRVSVEAEGFLHHPYYHTVSSLQPGLAVRVEPILLARVGQTIAGIVVDPDGNPMEGARVSADNREGRPMGAAVMRRPTAKDGRFQIENVPDAPLRVTAHLREGGSWAGPIRFPAVVDAMPGQKDIRIVLDPKLVRGHKK